MFFFDASRDPRDLHSFPTRRSSDLDLGSARAATRVGASRGSRQGFSVSFAARVPLEWRSGCRDDLDRGSPVRSRSEEHTSELQSLTNLVCRLLLEKKNIHTTVDTNH